MSNAQRSYLLAVPVIAGGISSRGPRALMYDVWKSLCCRETQRVVSGRPLGLLLWGEGMEFVLSVEVRWEWGRKDSINGRIESTKYVDNSGTFVDT